MTLKRMKPKRATVVKLVKPRKRKRSDNREDGEQTPGLTNEMPNRKPPNREGWMSQFTKDEFPLARNLDQLRQEQDYLSVLESATEENNNTPRRMMNDQQKSVAEHPPHIPLSVRAGAGTGKTKTMVTRAVQLYSQHGVDPRRILMLTFTNKAASEMRERTKAEFRQHLLQELQQQRQGKSSRSMFLPTVKTFHSLAYRWIRKFWRQCGLGRYPTLLVTDAQQKNFMKAVIQSHVKQLQLERCYKYLGLQNGDSTKKSWETVVTTMKDRYPKDYNIARNTAQEKFTKGKKGSSKATKEQKDELEILVPEIERQCYLELLRKVKAKGQSTKKTPTKMPPTKTPSAKQLCSPCDLESKWTGDTDQCKFYLELVNRARLGQHSPNEYLPKDADILRLYESMQERTGQIDFDKLLNVFVALLRDNDSIKHGFHTLYDYVIVDEFQDNSEVQSNLLLEIVDQGRVTVVGDDDQCIYEFRGAFPGNFETFRDHYSLAYCSMTGVPKVEQKILEANYRCTGNILRVGASFLKGLSFARGKKRLSPTREDGDMVELWKCSDPQAQAIRIAEAVKKRHDDNGVSWGQVACLFRCFRMGDEGILHKNLQQQLAIRKVPFKVVGGTSFLESEVVRDILAYIRLTLTGCPDRADDDAFIRVLNKPSRKLPKEALELIQEQQRAMNGNVSQVTPVCLDEAANALLSQGNNILSNSRRKGLENFLSLVSDLRVAAINKPLPDLVRYIWKKSGLAELHRDKKAKQKSKSESSEDEGQEGEEETAGQEGKSESTVCTHTQGESEDIGTYIPGALKAFISLAEAHLHDWTENEPKDSLHTNGVESLFNLAKKCVIEHADKNPWPPQYYLPEPLLDDLHMPGGIGLPVVSSFVADLALQMKGQEEDGQHEDDRVTISTIHRAKGLEWKDVYVPFFNEGYMPAKFREDDKRDFPGRHQRKCNARESKPCNLNCREYYASLINAKRRGTTPEERHSDEEQRLAHVAATRAKDHLVLVSVLSRAGSSFEGGLRELPPGVFKTVIPAVIPWLFPRRSANNT